MANEIEPSEARAGDVVLVRWRAHLPAKHAVILSEENRMVHAQEGASVSEVPLNDWWRRRMAYAFSFTRALSNQPLQQPSSEAEHHLLQETERVEPR